MQSSKPNAALMMMLVRRMSSGPELLPDDDDGGEAQPVPEAAEDRVSEQPRVYRAPLSVVVLPDVVPAAKGSDFCDFQGMEFRITSEECDTRGREHGAKIR